MSWGGLFSTQKSPGGRKVCAVEAPPLSDREERRRTRDPPRSIDRSGYGNQAAESYKKAMEAWHGGRYEEAESLFRAAAEKGHSEVAIIPGHG